MVTQSSIKRQRTRQRLLEAALGLFEERGYAETTTAQIAEAAGVSEMTLFRHFPSKDRLLLDDPYDPLIAAAVADQPAALPTIVRVTAGMRAAWRAVPGPAEAAVRRRLRLAAITPGLAGAIRANTRDTEDAIAEALSRTGADSTVARIAAAAALAALTEALMGWAASEEEVRLGDAIQLALSVLEGARQR